jgi:hypothetical protein
MKWNHCLILIFLLTTIGACSHQVNINISDLHFDFTRSPDQESLSPEIKKDRHLVFDIDWTIVKEIREGDPAPKDKSRLIVVEGKTYYVNEGVEDFIEEIVNSIHLCLLY